MGEGSSSSSPCFCPEMDGTRPGNEWAGRLTQSQQKSWPTVPLDWKSRVREGKGFDPGHTGNPSPTPWIFTSFRLNCRHLSPLSAAPGSRPYPPAPCHPRHTPAILSSLWPQNTPDAKLMFTTMPWPTPFLYLPHLLLTPIHSSKPGSRFASTSSFLVLGLRA